ncbi:MAG: aspartate--ammonia ligase [Bacteroidia bacterium]|nr:aspartate--ammonia ligase [Bacteroidia bacterium]
MLNNLIIPEGYKPAIDLKQTEKAIKLIKDFFQLNLSDELNLDRVTAPLFVLKGTGINDDLNGIEKPVSFSIKDMKGREAEIVQSLAKWKRMMLADYNIEHGNGIYTDMNAIRPDEILDNLHSLYVDQWDWERVISEEERTLDFLKLIVRKIYSVIYKTELFIFDNYPLIKPVLPEEIIFIHSEKLYELYPDIPPAERENKAAEKYGAVFIIGIGNNLPDGKPHDGRAPDYDDWTTETKSGYKGLNGDIVVWNPVLGNAFELSSMGIRVDKIALLKQLEITGAMERTKLMFHKRLLNGELPLSIGGGIGQSRLCMFYLRKAHIGEVQASVWSNEIVEGCKENRIELM